MLNPQFQIKLRNRERVFTTLSNFSEQDVFTDDQNRKWTRAIFFLHGFPDNNSSYNKIWEILLKSFPEDKGVLLLSPLMRGYEPSSQGNQKDYRVSNLAEDVHSWIKSIVPDHVPVHIVGHDWGAITAFKTASNWPALVTSMVCLAIPYLTNIKPWELVWNCPQQMYYSSYMFTMQFSSLYRKRLSDTSDNSYLDRLWSFWSPTWKYSQQEISSVKKTFQQPGVIDATTAYYRCIAKLCNLTSNRWEVDFERVPTLIIGGERDGCMNRSLYDLEERKLSDMPNVKVRTLSNLGHFLHREDPKKVAELISDWFRQYP